ncbi:hypothetical protein J6590_057974, partial [Homalodisca vitripennis]
MPFSNEEAFQMLMAERPKRADYPLTFWHNINTVVPQTKRNLCNNFQVDGPNWLLASFHFKPMTTETFVPRLKLVCKSGRPRGCPSGHRKQWATITVGAEVEQSGERASDGLVSLVCRCACVGVSGPQDPRRQRQGSRPSGESAPGTPCG